MKQKEVTELCEAYPDLKSAITKYADDFSKIFPIKDSKDFIFGKRDARKIFFDVTGIEEEAGNIITEEIETAVKADKRKAELNNLFPTIEELLHEELEPLTFVIDDFLPSSGVFILSSKPKTGKTFLAMQMAEAVATGGKFLDQFDTDQGEVLYLMTQGGKRVLKNRMHLIKDCTKKHDNMHYLVTLPPLDQGGYEILQTFINKAEHPKMIVLDMITNLIPNIKHSNYQAWAGVFEKLNDFAINNNICILCVYHSKKEVSEDSDSTDDVIGSTGILGSVSGILTLRRSRDKGDGEVFITLREAESKKKTLHFEDAHWSYLGDYIPNKKSEKAIYELLSEHDEGLSNQDISSKLKQDKGNTNRRLKSMIEANFIYYDAGRYFIRQH